MRYPIVRLQVQTEPLKVGTAPLRRYDPSSIESVHHIEVSSSGVIGFAERYGSVTDVHHVDHEHSRDRKGLAGVSIMGTGDYATLRARYGDHLTEGIAGETLLLDAPAGLAGLFMPPVISVITTAGVIELTQVRVADPCVEFSRFCLGQQPSSVISEDIKAALIDLDNGHRGYRAVVTGSGVIGLGDFVEISFPV